MKNQYSLWSQYLNILLKYSLIAVCMSTIQGKLWGITADDSSTAEEREKTERYARKAKRDAKAARRAAEDAADEARRARYDRPYGYGYRRHYPYYYRRHHRPGFGIYF
jgi:hypothetical protein